MQIIVKEKAPQRRQDAYEIQTARQRATSSINILEFSTQQKLLVEEDAVQPESSNQSEEDGVEIGSVDRS